MADDVKFTIEVQGQDNVEKTLNSLQGQAQKSGKSMAGAFLKANVAFAAIEKTAEIVVGSIKAVAGAAVNLGKTMINTAAQTEQQRIAFATLLGSTEDANDAIDKIRADAKATPFELPGLISMNQQLISAGVTLDDSRDLINDLGDAVSAVGGGDAEMQRVVANFQQIKATGRASLMDIRQFANIGIPIFDMLADTTGKTKEEISEMISSGEIGFDVLEKAFDSASQEGGKFFNAMQDQSQSFNGMIANLQDTIGITLGEIAEKSGLFQVAKNALAGLLSFVERGSAVIGGFMTFMQTGDITGGFLRALGIMEDSPIVGSLMEMREAFQNVGEMVGNLKEAFGGMADEFQSNLKEKAMNTLNSIIQGITNLTWFVTDAVYAIAALIQGDGDQADAFIQRLFPNASLETIAQIRQQITSVVQSAIAWFQKAKEVGLALWDSLKLAFGGFVEGFKGQLPAIKEAFGGLFDAVGLGFGDSTEDGQTFIEKLQEAIPRIIEIATTFGRIFAKVVAVITRVITFVIKLNSWIRETWLKFKELKDNAIRFIAIMIASSIQKFNQLKSGIINAFRGIVGGIKGGLNSMIYYIERAINRIVYGYRVTVGKIPGMPKPNYVRIPRLQKGTAGFDGGAAMLGERGMEMGFMPRGSRVSSTRDTSETMAVAFERALRRVLGESSGSSVTFNGDVSVGGAGGTETQNRSDFVNLLLQTV